MGAYLTLSTQGEGLQWVMSKLSCLQLSPESGMVYAGFVLPGRLIKVVSRFFLICSQSVLVGALT